MIKKGSVCEMMMAGRTVTMKMAKTRYCRSWVELPRLRNVSEVTSAIDMCLRGMSVEELLAIALQGQEPGRGEVGKRSREESGVSVIGRSEEGHHGSADDRLELEHEGRRVLPDSFGVLIIGLGECLGLELLDLPLDDGELLTREPLLVPVSTTHSLRDERVVSPSSGTE